MKTILVPTDYSFAASNAAGYAVKLAKEFKAELLLLHVYNMPIPVTDVPIVITSHEELQKENENLLEKIAADLNQKTGVSVKYLAKMGLAVDEILEQEKNTHLTVMGMQGASKLSELLIGSITTTTLQKARNPVLVIPQSSIYKRPEKIVFACDYEPKMDIYAIKPLKDIAKILGSKIYVLNIKHEHEPITVDESLVRIKLDKELQGIEHIYQFQENEDLIIGIHDFIEEQQADLLAVIPHRYSLIERLFHKSISKKMAFHTNVPLLTLPDTHRTDAAYFL